MRRVYPAAAATTTSFEHVVKRGVETTNKYWDGENIGRLHFYAVAAFAVQIAADSRQWDKYT